MIRTHWQAPRDEWPTPSDLAHEPPTSPGLPDNERTDLMRRVADLQHTAHGRHA